MTGFLLPPKLPSLDAALHDAVRGTPDARWVAALSLGTESGERQEEAVKALHALLDDPLEEIRAQALEGLSEQARKGIPIAEEVIIEALGDRAAAVRCTAVDAALIILKAPEPSVIALADDPDVSVRLAACRAIGHLLADEGVNALKARLKDTNHLVRLEAAAALTQMGIADGETVLISALEWDAREASDAAKALGRLGASNARDSLEKLSGRLWISADLKAMAAAALARCSSGDKGREIITRMIASRNANQKLVALTTLADLPITGVTEAVGGLMASKDPLIVSSAIRTLISLATLEPSNARHALESHRPILSVQLAKELEEGLLAI